MRSGGTKDEWTSSFLHLTQLSPRKGGGEGDKKEENPVDREDLFVSCFAKLRDSAKSILIR